MKLDVVELFAGVGGFRVGLNDIKKINSKTNRAIENGHWNFVWANQWEPSTKNQQAYNAYITRFGEKNVSNLDISKVNKSEIPDHTLLVGGFPCQDYSVARSTSKEMGIEGKKGVLWWEIAEILHKKKTPFILLENVDRLLKSPAKQRGRDFAVMLKTFDESGYIVQWRVVNSGEYSMPQRRKRVFIFASRKNTEYSKGITRNSNLKNYFINDGFFNDIFRLDKDSIRENQKDLSKYKDIFDVSENYNMDKFLNAGIFINNKVIEADFKEISDEKSYTLEMVINQGRKYNNNLENYIIDIKDIEKWIYLKGSKKIPRIKPNGDKYFYTEGKISFPDRLDLPGRTMLTSEGTINRSSHIIYDERLKFYRKITEIEAEIMQMFPPNWTDTGMTNRQRYFMMGNALVTGIINRLEPKLRKIILDEK